MANVGVPATQAVCTSPMKHRLGEGLIAPPASSVAWPVNVASAVKVKSAGVAAPGVTFTCVDAGLSHPATVGG